MVVKRKTRLNIFIDETGEFGFKKGSAKLYGVSLVFHEQQDDIRTELNKLDEQFGYLGFYSMVHMGDLINGHEDFEGMSIAERKKIYLYLYQFAVRAPAKYKTIIVKKRKTEESLSLSRLLRKELDELVTENLAYFQAFDEVRVYYDGGQAKLTEIINESFGILSSYKRVSDFDHVEKKLFQVADMLTYIDKLIDKTWKSKKLSKTEAAFFDLKRLRSTYRALKPHRFGKH